MARVSLKHEDAMKGGVGIQEGNLEVHKSRFAVHQFPPNSKTGVQSAPFTAMRWEVYKLDENQQREDDATIEQLALRLGGTDYLRPGNLKNPDDLDELPDDLGAEVDMEGNSLFGEEGAKIGGTWPQMEESLRKCGFKAEVVGRGYAPDYEGMKLHVKTVETGRKYKDKVTGADKAETVLVCDRIFVYPYEKGKGSKGQVKGKPGASQQAANAAADSVKAEAARPETNGAGALASAIKVLGNLSAAFKAQVKPGMDVKRGVFQQAMQMELIRQKVKAAEQKPVMELIKDNDRVLELAAEAGFLIDFEAGTVQFPD